MAPNVLEFIFYQAFENFVDADSIFWLARLFNIAEYIRAGDGLSKTDGRQLGWRNSHIHYEIRTECVDVSAEYVADWGVFERVRLPCPWYTLVNGNYWVVKSSPKKRIQFDSLLNRGLVVRWNKEGH